MEHTILGVLMMFGTACLAVLVDATESKYSEPTVDRLIRLLPLVVPFGIGFALLLTT